MSHTIDIVQGGYVMESVHSSNEDMEDVHMGVEDIKGRNCGFARAHSAQRGQQTPISFSYQPWMSFVYGCSLCVMRLNLHKESLSFKTGLSQGSKQGAPDRRAEGGHRGLETTDKFVQIFPPKIPFQGTSSIKGDQTDPPSNTVRNFITLGVMAGQKNFWKFLADKNGFEA